MENEFYVLGREIVRFVSVLAIPLGAYRLGKGFLMYMIGDNEEEITLAIRQVVIGIIGISSISLILWFALRLADAVPSFSVFGV